MRHLLIASLLIASCGGDVDTIARTGSLDAAPIVDVDPELRATCGRCVRVDRCRTRLISGLLIEDCGVDSEWRRCRSTVVSGEGSLLCVVGAGLTQRCVDRC